MTKYLRYQDLVDRGRFRNRMTLRRHVELGLFPKPVHIGPGSVAWIDAEVDVYDEALRAARDAGVATQEDLADFVRRYVAQHLEPAAA